MNFREGVVTVTVFYVRVNYKIKIYKIIIVYVNIIQITVPDFLCFDFRMSVLIDYPLVSTYS